MTINFDSWKRETGNLPWGVQRAMYDVVSLVADGKASLVHGANFSDGKPCLVNAIAPMIAENVHGVSPCGQYPDLVSAFDTVCSAMISKGLADDPHLVSPLMAEFLLRNFGDLKEPNAVEATESEPVEIAADAAGVYVEPSDEEFVQHLLTMGTTPVEEPAPVEVVDEDSVYDR